MRVRGLAFALLLLGCRSSEDSGGPAAEAACTDGFVKQGELCAPHFDSCAEGQLPTFGGGCLAIGATCGEGFKSDGKGSCAPVLPEADCPEGETAIPGDAACHPLDDACGSGTYGDIPDDPGTVYVDQAAADGGDGTRAKPYRVLSDALATMAAGVSTVAIAAGDYTCNATIYRTLTLRGRCASMVHIAGAADQPSMQTFQLIGDVTIRNVSITGPYIGVGAYGGSVVLDHVRVHDTGFTAVEALSYSSLTKLAVRDSLLERGTQTELLIAGGAVTVDRTVLRATQMRSGKTGSGVLVRARKDPDSGVTHDGSLTITRSVISNTRQNGILLSGAILDADGLVVRGTRPDDAGSGGPGIAAQNADGVGSKVTLRHSFLSDNVRSQLVVIGGNATVEHTVAANGVLEKKGVNGGGFFFGGGATYSLTDSVSEKNHSFGIALEAGLGKIARVLVRDIVAAPDGTGLGIQVAHDEVTLAEANATLEQVRIDRCPQVGLLVFAAEAKASELAVFDTKAIDGIFGDGVALNSFGPTSMPVVARLTLEKSLVRGSARASVTVFGADLSIHSSLLACSPIDVAIQSDYTNADKRDPIIDSDDTTICGCETATTCHAETAHLAPVAH